MIEIIWRRHLSLDSVEEGVRSPSSQGKRFPIRSDTKKFLQVPTRDSREKDQCSVTRNNSAGLASRCRLSACALGTGATALTRIQVALLRRQPCNHLRRQRLATAWLAWLLYIFISWIPTTPCSVIKSRSRVAYSEVHSKSCRPAVASWQTITELRTQE